MWSHITFVPRNDCLSVCPSVRLDVCFHVISVSASQDLLKVSAFLFTLTFDFMLNWIYSAPKYLITLQRHSCCEKSMSWACSVEYKNRLAAFCAQTRAHTHTYADCDVMGRKESFHLQDIAKFFVLAKTFFMSYLHTYIHTFNINLCLCALFVVFFSWSSMWCEISFCLWVIRLAEEWLFCKNGQRRVLVQNWCTSVSNKTWQQAVQLDQRLSNNHFCFHFLLHLLFSLLYSLVWILCIFFVVQERVCGEVIFAMVVFCY